jgi:hypothetical protein
MTLRNGDVNSAVKRLQKLLTDKGFDPGPADGWFGDKTETAVKAFQKSKRLKPDGIVGTDTWNALGIQKEPTVKEANHHWDRVPADRYKDGYSSFTLREDVGEAYLQVYNAVKGAGGIIPSSGAKRELAASVGAGRSKTSFHYTGRALDIMIGSAMANPKTDPLVVESDTANGRQYWRVFVKADGGEPMNLKGVKWSKNAITSQNVSDNFIDLTELFASFGFDRIPARQNWQNRYINTEWWHFQHIQGLVVGQSTFGKELLKVYQKNTLEKFPPWDFRNYVFKGKYFGRP